MLIHATNKGRAAVERTQARYKPRSRDRVGPVPLAPCPYFGDGKINGTTTSAEIDLGEVEIQAWAGGGQGVAL